MYRALRSLALALAIPRIITAHAQGGPPTGVFMGEGDYKEAPGGCYAIDPEPAAVIARARS